MKEYRFLRPWRRLLGALMALCLLAPGVPGAAEAAGPELEVYFLDLGRVDAILIRCGEATCFIDGGFKDDAAQAVTWLRAMGITHLDSYVGTHGHYDHIEGAPTLISAFRPDRIYVSHVGTLSAILECADDDQKAVIAATEKVILVPGDSFAVGPAVMNCVGPLAIVRCNTGDSDENRNSLILRLDYGARRILFTGDTTDQVLELVGKKVKGQLRADVLKNPHHNGSHDWDVLGRIAPSYVVFCTDDASPVRQSYLDLLDEHDVRTICLGAGSQGHAAVITDGDRLEIRCGAAVSAVHLEPVSDMVAGQALELTASVEPAGALEPSRQLGYNSSDESVAVAHNGVVKAVGPGTATITAAALNGASDAVQVRVMDAVAALDQYALAVKVGQTARVKATIRPGGGSVLSVSWSSEDPGVATVSDGRITGVSQGRTRVVARLSNGAQSFCDVTVSGYYAESVKLETRKATLKVGDTLALKATVEPAAYDAELLEWRSSDESVLWVDGYGNVTAVRKGRAKIAVIAADGVTDTCTIKVN